MQFRWAVLVALLLASAVSAEYKIETRDPVDAAKALAQRVIPDSASAFDFRLITQVGGKDVWQISQLPNNRVLIEVLFCFPFVGC